MAAQSAQNKGSLTLPTGVTSLFDKHMTPVDHTLQEDKSFFLLRLTSGSDSSGHLSHNS